MAATKRPVIPTTEADLPKWLCRESVNLDEYLSVEGPRWVKIAGWWVQQIFGVADSSMANEIGWGALAIMCQHAGTGKLMEILRFRPWLNGVMKNMTRDAFDQYTREKPTVEIDPEKYLSVTEEPFDVEESSATIQKIHDCMKVLADGERKVIACLMVDPQDPPNPKDIAVALGISAGSVRVQLTTGRAKLEDCLKKKGVPL